MTILSFVLQLKWSFLSLWNVLQAYLQLFISKTAEEK
jgi:hypothetical protein